MSHRFRSILALLLGAVAGGCARAPETDPRMVSEWMHTLYGVVRSERIGPPVASRLLAYLSIALYEGMAAATPEMPTLAGTVNGLGPLPTAEPGERYDATLVAVAAERAALDSLMVAALPSTRATLGGLADSLIAARTSLGLDPAVVERSLALGRQIGNAVVAASRSDGFAGTRGRPYTPPSGPGLWYNDSPGAVFTAQNVSGITDFVGLDNPANTLRPGAASDRGLVLDRPKAGNAELPALNIAGVTEPFWNEVRPFMLRTWNECQIADPPPYSTDTASVLYQQARAVVAAQLALTEDERVTALYWADNPGETATPAGRWVAIASQMISERQLPAPEAARLFAATSMAVADAFIAGWGYKFQYNLIRPRTYIRRVIDPAWEPQIPTPPFPEYPAGHSSQSAAGATIVVRLLGDGPFADSTSVAIGHQVRHFKSFMEAADEAATSRLYGGIHFPMGNAAGGVLGRCIGGLVVDRFPGLDAPR
ncbi:MAG: vanadium-dependent haloperoxidase [Gemmatimonadota bacterium]|nr:vanadium-dependent haloperoxidase [Gemmatimonadota bacterium]